LLVAAFVIEANTSMLVPLADPIDTMVDIHILFEADALEPAKRIRRTRRTTVCPDCFALDGHEIEPLVAWDAR
jgi:hypothetical protein